jgi:hypothetical protein
MGHVIHYRMITTDPAAHTAVFTSADPAPSPGFRLTYKQLAADQLQVTFEISPTGKAADFKTYLDGKVTRRQAQISKSSHPGGGAGNYGCRTGIQRGAKPLSRVVGHGHP